MAVGSRSLKTMPGAHRNAPQLRRWQHLQIQNYHRQIAISQQNVRCPNCRAAAPHITQRMRRNCSSAQSEGSNEFAASIRPTKNPSRTAASAIAAKSNEPPALEPQTSVIAPWRKPPF